MLNITFHKEFQHQSFNMSDIIYICYVHHICGLSRLLHDITKTDRQKDASKVSIIVEIVVVTSLDHHVVQEDATN